MKANVQDLKFTRWVYKLKYNGKIFLEFKLLKRVDDFNSKNPDRYDLADFVEIEPFKNRNSKTRGTSLYFRTIYPFDPKDETGMFPTTYNNRFYGDIRFVVNNSLKKVFVLFQVIPSHDKLIVDVFDNFYTSDIEERNEIIEAHPWHIKKAPCKSALKVVQNFLVYK